MAEKNYVYFVKNIDTGLKYVGVRYAKNCTPEDFWVTYFTSSSLVKNLIKIYGKENFEYKILKVFDKKYDAIVYERKLLKLAYKRDDYLNLHYNFKHKTEEEFLDSYNKSKLIGSISGKISYKEKTGIFSLSKEERALISSEAGKVAGILNKKLNRAIFNKDVRDRQHKTLKEKQVSAYYDPKLRKDICSKGGKKGYFSKIYYKEHGLKDEDRINAQIRRGIKGGKNNKGFIWYNDGNNNYKYTSNQQENIPIEIFLESNKNYSRGRIQKSIPYKPKKVFCYKNGKIFKIFDTQLKASKYLDISRYYVDKYCKSGDVYDGFVLKYKQ